MQNDVPASGRVHFCVHLIWIVLWRLQLCLPGYHENTSVSGAQEAHAAEPVTYDYTYHPISREQEAGERRVGRGGKWARKWEGRES